jgi:hypothetical protein
MKIPMDQSRCTSSADGDLKLVLKAPTTSPLSAAAPGAVKIPSLRSGISLAALPPALRSGTVVSSHDQGLRKD